MPRQFNIEGENSVSGATSSDKLQFESRDGRLIRKRNRIPVSCMPCRAKRAKCNRALPCARCVESHQATSCRYFNRGQDRLRSAKTESYAESKVASVNLNATLADEFSYIGGKDDGHIRAQWNVVLEDIDDGKTNGHSAEQQASSLLAEFPTTLLGNQPLRSLHDIITHFLPPRSECDRLVSEYFFSLYGPLPIVHHGQFKRIYLNYWSDGLAEVSPLWLSVLFSVFAMAIIIAPDFPTRTFAVKYKYTFAATQCLIHGGYTKPKPWLIEALIMHFHTEYISNFDPPRELSLLAPMLVRLAYETGLHREPHPKMPVFEAEIRRRLIIVIRHLDAALSYQTGVPMSITYGVIETSEPRNLYDDDLHESDTSLPPSRPESQVSPMLCFIVKARLMETFAKIYEVAIVSQPPSAATIQSLDEEARATCAAIPTELVPKPLHLSAGDPKFVVMSRLNCQFLAQRSICVLHRRAMAAGNPESIKKCIGAATTTIECLLDIYVQMQPEGIVEGFNRLFSSTMVNDFFLSAVLLCLAVNMDSKAMATGSSPVLDEKTRSKVHSLLRESYRVSGDMEQTSAAVRRVEQAIGSALKKIGEQEDTQVQTLSEISNPQAERWSTKEPQLVTAEKNPTGHSGGVIMEDIWTNPGLENVFAEPTDIDWSLFDQFLNLPN